MPDSSRPLSKGPPIAETRQIKAIRQLISNAYLLHGALRSHFGGPRANTGLVLLEALTLGVIVARPAPMTVSQIGRTLGYSRQAVQRAANKLIEIKAVETAPNPQHKRASFYVATAKGRKLMDEVQRPTRELAEALAEEFSTRRAEQLAAEMEALLAAIKAHSNAADDED